MAKWSLNTSIYQVGDMGFRDITVASQAYRPVYKQGRIYGHVGTSLLFIKNWARPRQEPNTTPMMSELPP